MAPKRVKKTKAKASSQTFYYPFMAAPIPISLTEDEIMLDMHIIQNLLVAQQDAVKRASVEREVAARVAQQQAQAAAAAAAAASHAAAQPAAAAPAPLPARMDYQQPVTAYAAAMQAAQAGLQQPQPQLAQPAKAPGVASPCTMQQLQQLPQLQHRLIALA